MYSLYHLVWIFICIVLIVGALYYLKVKKVPLQTLLSAACVICILSEVTKTFSVLEMVPSSNGATMHLYLQMSHLPLHLCSIQILFIFFARFSKNQTAKETLFAFMYPTCTLGALFAIAIPTIFETSISTNQAFSHPLAYQYFLYHVMLVVLGVYIAISKEVDIKPKHYFTSLAILGTMAFVSIYLNSIFATPTYVDGELVSVDYSTNFLFTQETPINIPLTEKWHWFLYLGIIVTLAVVLIAIFYLPYFKKAKKETIKF